MTEQQLLLLQFKNQAMQSQLAEMQARQALMLSLTQQLATLAQETNEARKASSQAVFDAIMKA